MFGTSSSARVTASKQTMQNILVKNKAQTAVIKIVRFRIFINLTFRMLLNIHFQKWSKVTPEDNDETIYSKINKGSGKEIKNF